MTTVSSHLPPLETCSPEAGNHGAATTAHGERNSRVGENGRDPIVELEAGRGTSPPGWAGAPGYSARAAIRDAVRLIQAPALRKACDSRDAASLRASVELGFIGSLAGIEPGGVVIWPATGLPDSHPAREALRARLRGDRRPNPAPAAWRLDPASPIRPQAPRSSESPGAHVRAHAPAREPMPPEFRPDVLDGALRGRAERFGWEGEPFPSDLARRPELVRSWDRGRALRVVASLLGSWFPGCGWLAMRGEVAESRREARAELPKLGGVSAVLASHAVPGRLKPGSRARTARAASLVLRKP